MLTASFGPKVVEEEGSEDVERLSPVREAAGVVALEVRGVVLLFEDSFPQEDERPGDGEAVGRLPFIPSATESIPRLLGGRAIREAMLGRLRKVLVATFAGGLEPHGLEPRAHREPFVEGQPDEGSHFVWAGVVPDPSNNLGGCGVPKAQPLDEFDNPGGSVQFSCVLVSPFGGVAEERSVPHVVRLLPVPISRVPLKVGDKSGSEDPVEKGFLTWDGEVLGQSESCTMVVLSEYPDRFVPLQGDGDDVGAGGLDATRVGDSPEFWRVGGALVGPHDLVDPFWWAGLSGFLLADPFTCWGDVVGGSRVPWYAGNYEISIPPVDWVATYP